MEESERNEAKGLCYAQNLAMSDLEYSCKLVMLSVVSHGGGVKNISITIFTKIIGLHRSNVRLHS